MEPENPKRIVHSVPKNGGYARYVLLILFLCQVVSVVDRSVVGIFTEPMKHDLNLSDSTIGLLNGFAFVTLYAVFGFPLARWSDTGVRRTILALGLIVWSVATVFCGLARDFAQLFIARLAVGAGEAAGMPASMSMIADYFKPEDRPQAISILRSSSFFAFVVGMPLAGWLGQVFGWRMAFVLLGALGLPLALVIFFTVREPRRGARDPAPQGGVSQAPSLRETFTAMLSSPVFLILLTGTSFFALSGAVLAAWAPALLMREHELNVTQVGMAIGPVLGLAGFLGTIGGGVMASALLRRGHGYARVILLAESAALVGVPFQFLFVLHDVTAIAIFGCGLSAFLGALKYGPVIALMLDVMPAQIRGMVTAMVLLATSFIPAGVAPLIVGMLSDGMQSSWGAHSLRYAMIVAPVSLMLGALINLGAIRFLPRGRSATAQLEPA